MKAVSSAEFRRLARHFSKGQLVDALWGACQLGTNETDEQITIKAAREIALALSGRGEVVPTALAKLAEMPIDSDG